MKRIILLLVLLLSFVFYGRSQTLQKADAMQLVAANSDAIGITKDQVSKLRVSAAYTDAGIQYVYLIQTVQDLPVNQQMLVLTFRNNKLLSKSGEYNTSFEKADASATPSKNAADAIRLAFQSAKVPSPSVGSGTPMEGTANRTNYGKLAGVTENVITELMWQPVMNAQSVTTTTTTTSTQNGIVNPITGKVASKNPAGNTSGELVTVDGTKTGTTRSVPLVDPSKIPGGNNYTTGSSILAINPEQTLRLVWQVQVVPAGSSDYWLIQIDAMTGAVVNKTNMTVYEKHDDGHGHTDFPASSTHVQQTPKIAARNNFLPPPSVTSGVYNVIPLYFESPSHSPFTAVTSPWENAGVGNNATTHGWHFDGTTNYDSTRGNNVSAYLDIRSNNAPGGTNRMAVSTTPSPSLSFNFPHVATDPSSTEGNRNVALTNLFYWNNIIHDVSYQYGFTELAANFQNDNIGRGGTAGDYVRAEAQDASGSNNANFATPPADGGSPRMQMFLFTSGAGTRELKVNSPSVIAGSYDFAESNFSTANKLTNVGPVTAQVVYFQDANGTTNEACSGPPANELDGKIALIKRTGGCGFTTKVKQAQMAGAVGVIVINSVAGAPVIMGGSDNSITIPAVMVSDVDGATLASHLMHNVNVTLSAFQLPGPDGDLDNGVIIHEYVHGISNRFTGGPLKTSGCLSNAEQGGEGWSDYYGLMLTTDWSKATINDGAIPRGVGTYAMGQPTTGRGIREVPYTTDMSINPLTYSHVAAANGQVHRIGTLWGSALWDMTWGIIKQENSIAPDLYKFDLANTGGNMIAFKLVNEGMRIQRCSPGFLDARDAIIQADINLYNGRHACTIWEAFARRGMGFSAVQGSASSTSDQVQPFDMPGPAKFTAQPADQTICPGGTATFSSTVFVPISPVTYQWQKSTDGGTTWTDITGATSTSYTTPVSVAADNGSKYRLNVTSTNPCNAGTVSSNAATLNVIAAPVGGTVSPASTGTCAAANATGTLTLSGHSGTIIRWERSTNNGTSWTNVTNTTNTLAYSVTVNTMYRVFVQGNGCAAGVYSSAATITVNPSANPLSIIPDPSATVCIGDLVKLTLMEGPVGSISTGSAAVSYAAGATFNFRNNNNYPVVITDIGSVIYFLGSNVQIYYKTTGITTRPTAISAAEGWQRLFSGAVPTNTILSQATLGTGLNLVVPPNTTYGIYVEATGGYFGNNVVFTTTTSTTPVITSSGNCDIITGGDVGVATDNAAPTSNIATDIVLFQGNVKFKAASAPVTTGTFSWTPAAGLNNTTTPVVAASPTANTTYTVSHDNGAGCVRQASIAITVDARPAITTQPINTTACETSDATFSVVATGAGLTYQWEQSTDNCTTYTPITGATSATLRLLSVNRNMNGYGYRCKIQGSCTPVIFTECVKLKVDTLPPALSITPTGVVCGGQAGINGTLLQINNPSAGGAVTTATFSSTASVTVPDNDAAGATSMINVSGIPANVTITKITVTLNMPHTYPGDMIINLKGPNLPAVTNLYKYGGGAGTGNVSGASTWGWYGAQIEDGGTAFKTVAASPYIYGASTIWAPDGLTTNVGSGVQNPAGYTATATTLRALYAADPNGTWTLAMADGGTGDIGTLSGWSIKIEYTTDPNGVTSYTWAPATGLYTDDKATIAYVAGTQATSVYAAPTIATTYAATVTYTGTGCANKAQVAVNNTPVPYVTQFDSPVCLGDTVRIINRAINATPAVWSPVTGLYTDANATIPYVAGTPKDTLWAKPLAVPATYTVNMSSMAKPMNLIVNNSVTTLGRTATFNLRNNNLFPVILNEISAAPYEGTSADIQVWYKTTAVNGPTGAITTANGWTELGTATITPTGDRSIQTFLSGLTLSIPANATYGFVVTADQSGSNGLLLSNSGSFTISSEGSVDLLTGPNMTFVSTSLPPTEPASSGYFFIGGVKVIQDVSPACAAPAKQVTLAVHGPAVITTQPVSAAACTNGSVSFTTATTGSSLMHNWRVSSNGGLTWTDVVNNTLYSGAKTATLTITAPPMSMTGYQYRDSITTPACGGIVSNTVTLSVNNLPVPAIASPDLLITPGQTTTITATSTPAAAANGWAWTLNGTAITGSGNTQTVGINQLGVYQARVTDANGCSALSNELVIGAEGSDRLWIYPNPNNGVFNVRLYFDNTLPSERRVVTIYDMLGQKMASQEYSLTNLTPPYMEMTFDLSRLAAGTYLVQVTDRFSTKKASGLVVIQR